MPDELNPEAEEDNTSNPLEGDESSSSDDLEEVFADEEESSSSDNETLAAINQKSGKNFKSLDDVAKSLRQADKLFAEQGQKAKEKAKGSNSDNQTSTSNEEVLKELILVKHPEAEHVLKDIKQIAKSTNRNILQVYREETWLQEKARAEEKRIKDEQKISSPESRVEGQGYDAKKIGSLSAKDKALLRRHNLTEKDIKPAQ